jgi:hypothetical protein
MEVLAMPIGVTPLLDDRGAAALLGISRTTFRDVVAPSLPRVRIGRCVRYEMADLTAWVRAHKEPGGCASCPDITRTLPGSLKLADASDDPQVQAILRRLLSKRRASTRRR